MIWWASIGNGKRWMGGMTKAPFGSSVSGPNPTDRAKKGTKRSMLTDGVGIPLALVVAGADCQDYPCCVQPLMAS